MSTITKEELLSVFPVFRKAGERLLFELLSISQRRSFMVNQHVYREGEACSAIGFLLTGSVRVYKVSETGREITLYDINPGETCILSASSVLAKRSYPANAVTTESGELLLIAASDFKRFVHDHEIMRTFIFTLLADRLGDVMSLIDEVVFSHLDERILTFVAGQSGSEIYTGTDEEIATALQSTPERVTRLIKDLERRGYIKKSRTGIRIVKTSL